MILLGINLLMPNLLRYKIKKERALISLMQSMVLLIVSKKVSLIRDIIKRWSTIKYKMPIVRLQN